VWCPSSGTAAVSPTPDATTWNLHVNTVSRPLQFTRVDSTKTSVAYNPDAVDHLVDGNSMIAQFVSQILPPQTIAAQQIGYGAEMSEVVATNNLFPILRLYGCSVDGTSNLGTMLAGTRGGVELTLTTLTGAGVVAASTAITFNVPWRLVAEWGVGGLPTDLGVDTHNASISFDTTFASGAITLMQSGDTGNGPSMIVFSEDIITSFGGDGASMNIGI
jgi:hypothetical protein